MSECSTKSVRFSSINRRQVVVDFDGGRLTSDAGVLLLREVDRQTGRIDAINECIPDPRDPTLTVHEQREMIAQRIFLIALGYEDLNDQQTGRRRNSRETQSDLLPELSRMFSPDPTEENSQPSGKSRHGKEEVVRRKRWINSLCWKDGFSFVVPGYNRAAESS